MNHEELEQTLGYHFSNPVLLEQALTHPSTDSSQAPRLTYERLEFLGDAILQLAVTQFLYEHLPHSSEGELTQLRARVVSRANLGKYGFLLHLDRYIRLGKGEEKAGGRKKNSIMANTFESVFGAMSLDSGFEVSKEVALRLLRDSLASTITNPKEINPKGELQAVLQEIFPETPSYHTEESGDRDSAGRFCSRVVWREKEIGLGAGASKRKAEVAAAQDALQRRIWEEGA
jgi:ribonuclease-3